MFEALGGRLTSYAIRSMARALFPGFYERGISANQALRELREVGLGYRRQDFLRDFGQGREGYISATRVKYVNLDKTVSEGILEPAFRGVPDKYSLVFRAEGIDRGTGERGELYYYYHRSTLDTRRKLEEDAYAWISSKQASGTLGIEKVTLVEGYINPLWA